MKYLFCFVGIMALMNIKGKAQSSSFASTYANAFFENKMFLNPAYTGSNAVWQAGIWCIKGTG
jgi:hypothetical protein